MPLCGFTKEMLSGLDAFLQGLEQAVHGKGIPSDIALRKELTDIAAFTEALTSVPDPLRKMLVGISNFAGSYYEQVRQRDGKGSSEAFQQERTYVLGMLEAIDERYYDHLDGKMPEPMQALASWIRETYTKP